VRGGKEGETRRHTDLGLHVGECPMFPKIFSDGPIKWLFLEEKKEKEKPWVALHYLIEA
jgi:hypothetical protein